MQPDPMNPAPRATDMPAAMQQAHQLARASGRPFFTELQALTGQEPRALLAQAARLFAMPVVETADMLAARGTFDLLPLSRALQRCCALLRSADGALTAVLADPFDTDLLTWMGHVAGAPVRQGLALPADIQAYLTQQEADMRTLSAQADPAASAQREGRPATVLTYASVTDAVSPAIKLLNATLYDALRVGASDIHLEATASGLAIKYRIDGVLDHAGASSGVEGAEHVISRLKVLAELDISERRVPQDGSFRVELGDRDVDLRVSIMPSIHGEDAVIRVLDKRAMVAAHGALRLEALGFDAAALVSLRNLITEPHGMLLVTGPTGSGKTTTLYAALTEIHDGRDKIITIEDPVEYQLAGILQIPVNEKKGLTFARGLRSILRHDPDKIMIGEIRDRETAEIAVQSALTGHLVLTTVHANNVFDVFGRFGHMGIDPYAFVSALNGIWAQRLIRTVCPHCGVPTTPQPQDLVRLQLTAADVADHRLLQGQGCGDCRGTGYKGRRSIAEILTLTDDLRELILEKRPMRQIKEAARRNGTRTLREAALDLARQGLTSLAEVRRVTQHA